MKFYERLRVARVTAKLSSADMAAALGCTAPTYLQYENEKRAYIPSVEKAAAMAKALNVSLDYLGGLTDDPTPNWNNDPAEKITGRDDVTAIKFRLARIEAALRKNGIEV